MSRDAIYLVNQIVGFSWAAGSLMLGTVFVCYFVRNWPPVLTKVRFQLVLALAVIFLTLALREFLSAFGWDRDPVVMATNIQDTRLVFGIFKFVMGGAGLLALRALSYELYREKLWLCVAATMLLASVASYFYYS